MNRNVVSTANAVKSFRYERGDLDEIYNFFLKLTT